MSVIKSRYTGLLVAVSLMAFTVARGQDFDSLLDDLSLPSPTTLVTEAGAAVEPVAEAATDAVEEAADSVDSNVEAIAESVDAASDSIVEPNQPEALESDSTTDVTSVATDDFGLDPVPDDAQASEVAEQVAPAPEESVAPASDEVAAPSPIEDTASDDFFGDSEPVASEQQPAPEPEVQAETGDVSSDANATNETDLFGDFGDAADEASASATPDSESEIEPEAVPVEESTGAVAPLDPNASGLSPALVAQQEEVRRQASEVEAKASADKGVAAAHAGNFDEAIPALLSAQEKLPARPANKARLDEISAALGKSYLGRAEQQLSRNELKGARESFVRAQAAGADVRQFEKKLTAAEKREADLKSRPVPVAKRPEIVAQQKSIAELIREGRQFFEVRDYNSAEAIFERVLLQDEYNVEAMRFLRRIDEVRYKIRSQEREATAAELIQKVRDGWNSPVRSDATAPQAVVNRGAVETQSSAQKLQEKMEKIIIPSIEFRQANITDVINFLVEASIAGDPEKNGVNIILNLNVPGGSAVSAPAAQPAAAPAADFGFGDFGSDFSAPPEQSFSAPSVDSSVPTITLNLRRISLLDAIKYITEVARLKYRLEENAVMITPEGVVSGRVLTRLYPVQPSILDVIVEKEEAPQQAGFVELGAKSTSFKKSDVKDFFEKAGVPFPAGTSIAYNSAISQLIVANTPENLETFEKILARLNVIPNQVEIEARFVEISQDDLEELGFQWLLTDNWEIAQQTGPFGAGSAERVQMNADSEGMTKGLRFFGRNTSTGVLEPATRQQFGSNITPLGGIASFASVLTNPEVTLIVQALSQHGGTDLLSAPRVTTRSGVNAQIQVVREIIYPTEFDTTQPQFNDTGRITTPPVVTPGTFEKRETGVILNVTPTVGPDGYTIDLVMAPEVSELVDWIQYGSTITIPRSTGAIDELFTPDQTFTFNIPQPVFASRNVTTSIVIWDGQTVVMGGLIREDLIKVKDKIPGLGDIPLIGRLFRSEGEYSKKKNLLIFVTARLVDPAGKPINRGEALTAAEATATAAP
ncbi:MAG: hypothetical protein H3C50_09415 [Kiritimatiellae bacterium]|nr:hypothetical protein [Kiritimatiellia bacterium]MCO5067513.1 hypothetical protein [Kiritimatiellia bacterium]